MQPTDKNTSLLPLCLNWLAGNLNGWSMKKDTFLVYKDWYALTEGLTDEEFGILFRAIFKYVIFKEKEVLSEKILFIYNFILKKIDDNERAYEDICARRKAFGQRGGKAKATKSYQKLPNVSKSKQNLANLADTDTDTDTESSNEDKKKDIYISKEKFKLNVPDDFIPLVEEWFKYKRERRESYNSQIGVSKFCNALMRYSNGDYNTAADILDRSYANNWAGIFPLDNNNPSVSHDDGQKQQKGTVWQ